MKETGDDVARIGANDANPWILTATGAKLYFLEPEFSALHLADIAAHCGNLCRFTGAVSQFYSVAQHNVFVGQIVKKLLDDEGVDRTVEYWDQILAALLHDSEEAYMNDLSSPLKAAIRGKYKWIATGIRRKIFEKYGIDWGYYNATVKEADNIAILVERFYFMPEHPDWPGTPAEDMNYRRPEYQPPEKAAQVYADTLRYALLQRDALRTETPPASA
jgi:hypothetical protein